jgi:hypothetical protein
MASWREKREWRADFRDRGVENVRAMVKLSIFAEEKLRYARRWLWLRDHAITLIGLVVAACGVVVALIGLLWRRS